MGRVAAARALVVDDEWAWSSSPPSAGAGICAQAAAAAAGAGQAKPFGTPSFGGGGGGGGTSLFGKPARGKGRKGFGNARAMRTLFEDSVDRANLRQAAWRAQAPETGEVVAVSIGQNRCRLAETTGPVGADGKVPVRYTDEAGGSAVVDRSAVERKPTLVVEDVIGPRPDLDALPELRAAVAELERLTGLAHVKAQVRKLITSADNNYTRELAGDKVDHVSRHRLFLGNPGTGKTTVARIYGRVLKALNLLSNGDLVDKLASDFVGDVVGASQQKTSAIIELAKGKVLLIDEAYNLDDEMYGRQALNTIVEKVSGEVGTDMAGIMCGYRPQMLNMLRDQNPGLSGRFNPDYAFEFADFDDLEMLDIVGRLCTPDALDVVAPFEVKMHAVCILARRRAKPNFRNAAAAKTLLTEARQAMKERSGSTRELTTDDLDGRAAGEERKDPMNMLQDMQSSSGFVKYLEKLSRQIKTRRREGRDTDKLLGHFVFLGAPGTGKTTTGELMAKVLHGLGVLPSGDAVKTTGSDLTGQYVGQAKEKVREAMEAARGGVLIIDEAYDMGTGTYGREAVTKLLSMLTEPEYMCGKTVVVLAGYN